MVKCFKLKYPVSANRYWRNFKGVMVRSAEAKAYKSYIAFKYFYEPESMFDGDVSVTIELLPKLTKKGEASKTVIDLDNGIKITLDALNKIAYEDDKQIKRINAYYGKPVENGGVIVTVEKL